MHKLIILIVVIFIGCASKPQIVEPKLEKNKLYSFFEHVKLDLNNYGNIAIQKNNVLENGVFPKKNEKNG